MPASVISPDITCAYTCHKIFFETADSEDLNVRTMTGSQVFRVAQRSKTLGMIAYARGGMRSFFKIPTASVRDRRKLMNFIWKDW